MVLGGARSLSFVREKISFHKCLCCTFIMKFICLVYNTRVSHAMTASAIAAISKYHIPDKDSGVNVGRHPLVTTAKKAFWQQPPLPLMT